MDRRQPNPRPPQRRPQPRPPVKRTVVKKKRLPRDWTLLIFEAFGRLGKIFAQNLRNLRRWRYFRLSMLILILAGLVGGGVIITNSITRPNALSVAVNGDSLGIARWDRGVLDPQYLIHHTTTRLESQFGTTITISDDVAIRGVRAGRNAETITFDAMVTTLADALDFYVYGAIITVNGQQEATLGNIPQAESLLANIVEQFKEYEGQRYSFVENVVVVPSNIHKDNLMTASYAQTTLTTHRPVQEIHTVRHGESLYSIARRFGMTLPQLMAANPNVNPDGTGLRENDLLVVTPTIPIISVRTYERVTTEEILPFTTEHRPTPALSVGQQRIIQAGREGMAISTVDIISVNGIETERTTVIQQTTQEPLPEIIEVGSG